MKSRAAGARSAPPPGRRSLPHHDDRAALGECLLGEPAGAEPLDHVVWLGDLRIVVLDSTVPGLPHGELSAGQLDWLRVELARSAPDGTVLALHDPPLPTPTRLSQLTRLRNRRGLAPRSRHRRADRALRAHARGERGVPV